MANTYEVISSITVSATTSAAIEFTSIPSTYTDLLVQHSLRSNNAQIYDTVKVIINSNTSGIYSTRNLRGSGATAISQTLTSQAALEIEMTNGTSSTANTFGSGQLYIPNYTGNTNKSFSSECVNETNATTAYMAIDAGIAATTAAITSIEIKPGGGTAWFQHSSATLYGIKKD